MTAVEGSTDSAGQAWHERVITSTGFDDDHGQAAEALVDLLRRRRAGQADDAAVMAAVAGARLLVPVTAVAGEVTEGEHGLVDASVDMAVVTLVAPTGERAQPAFTSLAALAEWNADARPLR